MNTIHSICIITYAFPYDGIPLQPFVEQLVNTFVDMGLRCDVVVPRSITNSIVRKIKLPSKAYRAVTQKRNPYNVYFPRYFSISTAGGPFGGFFEWFNWNAFTRAAKRAVHTRQIEPDAFYGHFFNPSGLTSAVLSAMYDKPYYVACGENSFASLDKMGPAWVKGKLKGIAGVVAVSGNNKKELVSRGYVSGEKVEVFVNAIDTDLFYPRDKAEMRKKYQIGEDVFIVCFVGRFLEVKGPRRLAAALDQIDEVYSVFLGTDAEYPSCKNILFCGSVPHSQVPEYLSLADVFVLPTLAEGCCNAIIEAMACGLPVISSDLPFNDDILDGDCSIRIDTRDVEAIREAIVRLRDDKALRQSMASAALKKVESLSLSRRAERILQFMEGQVNDGKSIGHNAGVQLR